MSALDKLNKLNETLDTTEKKKEQERPEMPVPASVKLAFARLLPAQRVKSYIDQRIEVENGIVKDEMLGVYAEVMWVQGCRPTNPRVYCYKIAGAPDMNGLYQVQERFTLQYEKGESPVKVRIVAALIRAGFSADMADKIVENEIRYQPMTVLRPLDELAQGNAVEKSAAEKIISLVCGESADPLTAEEKAVCIQKIEVVEVKDGVLERMKQYCKDAKQLRNLFRVIQPVNFVSHAKFANEGTVQLTEWLADQAKVIVTGTKLEKKKK
jgi:predicted regulator of amino acid metabolism with ACT domain